ncbi:MAG TPA: hypothetical protein VFI95_05265 [Terriglobales bacterium]|nr:hypothetical protein [Terriglobales bacterium]
MRSKMWLCVTVALLISVGSFAFADQDHGRGHGRGHDRDGDDFYSDHDRHEMRDYYRHNHRHLPPGLAKKDRLPPGLERRLRVHSVLDDDMRGYMRPCPEELERRLPPPPPQCEHTVIGGHVVLVNRSTYMVLDIFHFDR